MYTDTLPTLPRPSDLDVNDALRWIAEELARNSPPVPIHVTTLVAKLVEQGVAEAAVRWAVHKAVKQEDPPLLEIGRMHWPTCKSAAEQLCVSANDALKAWRSSYQQQLQAAALIAASWQSRNHLDPGVSLDRVTLEEEQWTVWPLGMRANLAKRLVRRIGQEIDLASNRPAWEALVKLAAAHPGRLSPRDLLRDDIDLGSVYAAISFLRTPLDRLGISIPHPGQRGYVLTERKS